MSEIQFNETRTGKTEGDVLRLIQVMLKPVEPYYYNLIRAVVYEVFRNFGLDVYGWKCVNEHHWQFKVKKSRVLSWFCTAVPLYGRRYRILKNGSRVRVERITEESITEETE